MSPHILFYKLRDLVDFFIRPICSYPLFALADAEREANIATRTKGYWAVDPNGRQQLYTLSPAGDLWTGESLIAIS